MKESPCYFSVDVCVCVCGTSEIVLCGDTPTVVRVVLQHHS